MLVTAVPELQCIYTFTIQHNHSQFTNVINAVAISPDNTKIAIVGDKPQYDPQYLSFIYWDLLTGKEHNLGKTIPQETHRSNLSGVAFSTDSKYIALTSLDYTDEYRKCTSLSFWDIESIPKHTSPKNGRGGITTIVSHPKEQQFVTISVDGVIRQWHDNNQTGELNEIKNWQGHKSASYDMIFSADGRRLCSGGSDDNIIRVWDSIDGSLLQEFPKQGCGIRSLALSSDGKTIASGSDQRIMIWDAQTGELRKSFFGHPDWIRGLVTTPDDQFLLSIGNTNIKIWDLMTGELLNKIHVHENTIRGMAMSQDGKILVTGSREGVVKVWKVQL
jgi:hypothetical protein